MKNEKNLTYTDFKEWQEEYLKWMNSMPKFYNNKFLAVTGIFCNNENLDEFDAKEFMFPNVLEIHNMDEDLIKFSFICMIEEWEKKINDILNDK